MMGNVRLCVRLPRPNVPFGTGAGLPDGLFGGHKSLNLGVTYLLRTAPFITSTCSSSLIVSFPFTNTYLIPLE